MSDPAVNTGQCSECKFFFRLDNDNKIPHHEAFKNRKVLCTGGGKDPLYAEIVRHREDGSMQEVSSAQERQTFKTGGMRDVKLARFDLIPPGPMILLAELFGKGARKYSERNWEKGLPWNSPYQSLMRHMHAFWAGEDIDEETGLPHVICAMWNAMVLAEFMNTHPELDDRPGKVKPE